MDVTLYIVALIALIVALVGVLLLSFQPPKTKKENKKSLSLESSHRTKDKRYNLKPEDNFLSRDKKKEEYQGVTLYTPHQRALESHDETRIVGLAEPKGFWSKFIMSQKLGFIMARLNAQSNSKGGGFWVNLIKAQDMSQSRDQSRGR
jgi:hypothetical protein